MKKFHRFTFDARRRQVLFDDAHVIHLTPKAFDLLGLLLEAAPAVVRKSEVHERLWPGTFVTDATLVGLVKELRRALTVPESPSALIRTSHGVGYAFCAEIQTLDAVPPDLDQPSLSIAVLPFANLSGDPQDTYFTDGLAEELIDALAQLPRLRVASRTSAFRFRDHDDVAAIARHLHVDHVLEGSVRRAGVRVRISVRLVSAADGHQLWSARYERQTADVFEVYDDITQSIVSALRPALSAGPPPVARRHSTDIEAYELYLRGRHRWHQRTPESLRMAIAHFEAAIRLDPDYALAHAALSDAYSILAFYGYLPLPDARSAAGRAAARALELAPQLPESHYAAALYAMWLSADWRLAEASYQRTIAIQPRFTPAHTHYAAFLSASGRVAEARTHLRDALALEPLSPAVFGTGALCMFTAGDYEEAIRLGERALALHPNFAVGLYALGLTHCRTGDYDRAADAFDRLLAASQSASYFQGWRAVVSGLSGRDDEARQLTAALASRYPGEYVHPLTHVLVGLARRDPVRTVAALEDYCDERGPGFQVAHVVPFLDAWRLDSPFSALLSRLHLCAGPPPG